MSKNQKKLLPIDYTHREFSSIQQDLLEIAERFYPESFQDFSEGSFGALMVDAVSYVGDQLSFYMDYNINESFLDTAFQFSNIVRHGRALGYKYEGRPSTYGKVALYIQVPASTTGIGPDRNYLPVLKRGSTFNSTNNLSFILTENVDFADTRNLFVAARNDSVTGAPTFYAVKTYGNVVSGQFGQERVTVGTFEKFKQITLNADNVSEVISVYDSQGNQYYEVDFLAQDVIFKEVTNPNFKNDNVPSIIKPLLVSRKFITFTDRNSTTLQFGSGRFNETNVVENPQNVAVNTYGKTYVTTTTFDPSRLSENESFGIVPSNTELIVTYRTNNPINSNVASTELNSINFANYEFIDQQNLNSTTLQTVRDSLDVSNEEPITGDISVPTSDEIKQRIYDTFPTQNRAVTQADYENMSYRMPPKFGSIKRVSVQKDANSQKRNLNLYIISEGSDGKLLKSNSSIKNNLKTWINQYRMINDTVDILDPYILNYGIEFVVRSQEAADKYIVLDSCMEALKENFTKTHFIGESLYISDIYRVLKEVSGVLDVLSVKIFSKTGANYSNSSININSNLSGDGSQLIVPNNAILELKFPEVDIVGKLR
ncbi:MAG: hypothetical protein CML45_00590 [Rhodobacteraceae bacterium]|nr:hypothetical protein [Paracoccaceae bacterium]|tara:strand:+ start:843 stop:2639 length:1797 start_codon:yes stop_codon:yes gene_type:complete